VVVVLDVEPTDDVVVELVVVTGGVVVVVLDELVVDVTIDDVVELDEDELVVEAASMEDVVDELATDVVGGRGVADGVIAASSGVSPPQVSM
jgi:hypothetical protein